MSAAIPIVSELMHQPLVSVGPGASVEEAIQLAKSKGIHHVPIVQSGKLLGMVCTCDLGSARPDLRVLQLARRNVVTVEPDCSTADAARLMVTSVVGSLVVRNGDGLWGIVTRSDLVQADEALASVLAELKCAACQSTRHLRPGPGDGYLCVHCAERASASHWFDEGCGG
jgi:predicted transcriptional regulator